MKTDGAEESLWIQRGDLGGLCDMRYSFIGGQEGGKVVSGVKMIIRMYNCK